MKPETLRSLNLGDEGIEAFYRRALPATLRLAHLLIGSVSVGQDVAQDAMVARCDEIDNPSAYLQVTGVNLSRSVQRRSILEHLRLRGRAEAVTTIPELDET